MESKISLVIPVYNVEKYLDQCLSSVMLQTYQHLEIILVNDGSTDSCAHICNAFAKQDARVTVIHKENGGLSDARNAGLKVATGQFITFVDSDDQLSPDYCRILLEKALVYDADIIECGFKTFSTEKIIPSDRNDFKSDVAIYSSEEALALLIKSELKQTVWNKLYKKEVISNIPFEKGRKHEDEFWTYQIIAKAKKIVQISDELYFYRQHAESIMGEDYSLKNLDAMDAQVQRLKFIKNKHPDLLQLTLKHFWFAASAHYQNLTKRADLDKRGLERRRISSAVKSYHADFDFKDWEMKGVIWFYFFSLAPGVYAKVRNFLNVGI